MKPKTIAMQCKYKLLVYNKIIYMNRNSLTNETYFS